MKKLLLIVGLAAFSLGATTTMAAPHNHGYKKAQHGYYMKHKKAQKAKAMKARKAKARKAKVRRHRHY